MTSPGSPEPVAGHHHGADVSRQVLDQSRLAELHGQRAPGEPDILPQLYDIFLRESAKRVAAVREAVEHGDADGLRRAAHALKGSAWTFGADEMHGLATSLDTLATTGTMNEARLLGEKLADALDRVRIAIAQISGEGAQVSTDEIVRGH